ncbi:hypothetical protein Tsubulata_032207 [Turnera subulata]|uniref:Phytocyanin domain-containing protein n=1 Tax=Turnera subulata TaxID=218843 RepID=A0A9Q0F3G6_9ROSI|nr:hypothetical protein Tsubulata_032207 [Turnera subulata]
MALGKRAVALVMAMSLFQVIHAVVHKVGDSAGWTTIGNVDYKQWAATKTFQVGDIIPMALGKRAVALVMAMSLFQVIHAVVHKVGDSAGWTTIGNVDYKQWAATKTFQVGDIILFQYNAQFHNVMRVTHAMYRACNTSAPMATYTTGNDSITITSPGHHFFFCGVPGHCQAGQKVDINVPRLSVIGAPAPAVSTVPSPSVPAARVAGPSPNNALPMKALKSSFGPHVGLVMVVVAFFLVY